MSRAFRSFAGNPLLSPIAHPVKTTAQAKEALRERFRAFRAQLSEAEYRARSRAIVARMLTVPELGQAETIHVYRPMTARREVDVRPLMAHLATKNKQIVLPVVVTFGRAKAGAPRLRLVRLTGETTFRVNRWGIHEPVGGETVPPEALDLVIVPALGAGRNGFRIGQGLGYYDEFLAGLTVPTLCPVYAECLVESVPAEPHDVPVSILVTEHEVVRTTPTVTSPSEEP